MSILAVVIAWTLFGLGLFQSVFGACFAWLLYRCSRPIADPVDTVWPKATILVSLRGADSELADSLRRLFRQDYPDYEIQIVVDSVVDPAWEIVTRAINEEQVSFVHLAELKDRNRNCGLQCGSLVQAARSAAMDSEIMVTIDGDVVTHPTWLKELVRPMVEDPRVGATFGNRWFIPSDGDWGSMVRQLWNSAAVVPMWFFGIPWGGSLAIRGSSMKEGQLVEKWSRGIVHDAPVKQAMDELGLRVQFVPSVMIALRDRCDLTFCLDFLKRQMIWTRLYHPNWLAVLSHALATFGVQLIAFVLVVIGVMSQQWDSVALVGGAALGYVITMMLLLALVEFGARQCLRRRGEASSVMPIRRWLMLPLAIPFTQVVYTTAVLLASLRSRVKWRGVTYEIRGPWNVTMLDDRPFEQSAEQGISL